MTRMKTRTRILSSIGRSPDGNPFSGWLYSNLTPDIELHWFDWRTALFGRYEVFHLHWPEYLFGTSSSLLKTGAKALLAFAFLGRLTLSRTPVIQTVHTREPYEAVGRITRIQTQLLRRRTAFSIFLNESPENDLERGCVILLGRYEAPTNHSARRMPGTRVLFFGLLRAYKGIEELLEAFRELEDDALTLSIMGMATKSEYGRTVSELASMDPRVELTMRRVDDDELSDALAHANLVVLPYRTMYNSSALLLSIDHLVPVLATNSPSNVAIQREVGGDWLRLFDGRITPTALRAVLDSVGAQAVHGVNAPDLSRRDWRTIGRLHSELFRYAAATPLRLRRVQTLGRRLRANVEASQSFGNHSRMNLPGDEAGPDITEPSAPNAKAPKV